MRPYPEEVLRAIQAGIAAHFAPELESNYGKAQLAFSMMLFSIATRDYDSAVPDLVEGNAALRRLLGEGAAALAEVARDDARAARDAIGALPAPAASLRLSALRAEHEALRAAVAALAPLVEPAEDVAELAPLRAVRRELFAWLKGDAQRRAVQILSA